MATQISLTGDGPERLHEVMRAAGASWSIVGRDIVEELTELMLFVAQREAPTFQSNLKNSLTRKVGIEGKGASQVIRGEVFSNLAYAEVMDQGRKPNAKPPPPAELELWVKRTILSRATPLWLKPLLNRKKGGPNVEGAIKAMAFVVARSIGKKGIKGRKFFQKAMEVADRNLSKVAEAALRRFEQKTLGGR